MRHDVRVEDEECGEGRTSEGPDTFLFVLKDRMEQTLMKDAEEPRKVVVGDYLKLATIAESEASRWSSGLKEVVVRWEDPAFMTKSEDESS
jgi:hypothetical protein